MLVDPLKDYLGYVLRRASAAAMQKLSSQLSDLDLRPSEATVLLVIEANRDISQSEIGRFTDWFDPCVAWKRPITASLMHITAMNAE